MKFIQNILEKFLIIFRLKSQTIPESQNSPKEESSEYVCGISFRLTEDFEVDILGFIPDTDSLDAEHLVTISEKYAQLLLSINKGYLTNKILAILKDKAKNSSNTNEQLFLNNVVTFYDLLKIELMKSYNKDFPMIRPTSVFRSK